MKNTVIITTVGAIIGIAEALLYYNLGKHSGEGKFQYKIPPTKEFLKTVGVVLVTSMLTAAISSGIESLLPENEMADKKEKDKAVA